MGNPHCVVLRDELNFEEIMKYGTYIENHVIFPNRTNVQFVKLLSPESAEILIWERGVGFTNASGSSACAVTAILKKLNKVKNEVTILMPGGALRIECDEKFNIKMTGEVEEIIHGQFSQELIDNLNRIND
jgi:diaminopimelate epimerase